MSKFCSCGWPYLETDELIIHIADAHDLYMKHLVVANNKEDV